MENKIIKYGDDKSTALVLDTNDTYHKGSYINNRDTHRFLLQVIYEPKYLSFSSYAKFYKNFYRFLKNTLLTFENRL
ncbi:hypothetical protein N9R73_00470 [Candidatus Pelagibacter sp.]|nr:hypothetical protein [Candidatus Pelagibacter sp.]